MDLIKNELKENEVYKLIQKCKKGDLVSFHYNTVGHKAKTKKIIAVYNGLYGKGTNKMVRIVFTKSGAVVKLSLPLNFPLLQGFSILKSKG
jgi:hypothetical protein